LCCPKEKFGTKQKTITPTSSYMGQKCRSDAKLNNLDKQTKGLVGFEPPSRTIHSITMQRQYDHDYCVLIGDKPWEPFVYFALCLVVIFLQYAVEKSNRLLRMYTNSHLTKGLVGFEPPSRTIHSITMQRQYDHDFCAPAFSQVNLLLSVVMG
jgi:hypothetical protein